jgi:dipeptidyl aminopeptidase/acylaminoacyl peptidase
MLRRRRDLLMVFGVLALMATGCEATPPSKSVTVTPTARASHTRAPTTAPSPTSTATPTTAELLKPYTIEGLRGRKYAATHITVGPLATQSDIFRRYPIRYTSDGLTITGVMQIPVNGKGPFPVIVMNHGYFNREEFHSGDGTDRAAEYLNKHGYLTLASDYRSWGDSEIGPSLYYSGLVIDVINLMMGVGSLPEADPNRIGLWGHSMGGGVTMKALMVKTPARAAVLYSTVSADDADILARWGLGCIGDILAGEHQLGCNSSDVVPLDLPPALIKAYYEASLDPAILSETSPIYHLDLVSVPIQIHYGTNDGKTSAGTPPEWSRKLYDALEKAGKQAQLFGYEGEQHSFNGDAWIAFMERAARFFDDYVKNGPG